MKIYYIDIDELKKQKSRDFLQQYNDINLTNEKRFFEYTTGRYLVKSVAKSKYKLVNTDIIKNDSGKPVFKEGNLHFNISHSKNILIACFDKTPCGIDIEYIKERDSSKLSKYFKKEFKNLDEFYKFWTLKEAVYKLNHTPKDSYSLKFKDKFYISVASKGLIEDKNQTILPFKL